MLTAAKFGTVVWIGRPFRSIVVVVVLFAGEVLVNTFVAALYTVVAVLPFTVTVSVCVCKLNGSVATARVAVLDDVPESVKFDGVFVEKDFVIGDCIPKRGSGPTMFSRIMPVDEVVTVLPSGVSTVSVNVPSGLVLLRCTPPVESCSTK